MLKNSNKSYGWLSIAVHWLMAIAILFMFSLGLYMVELTYYDAWYKGSLDLHKSLGMVLLGLLMFRVFWRATNIKPAELAGPKWEQRSAHWMHRGLYLGMLCLMISGYLISTADGRAIVIFDLLKAPALPWAIEKQEDIAGQVHAILSWLLIAMTTAHALAAIKHHFINKDGGLTRMLKVNTTV
ncbi:cytochrome B [Methylophaga sp. 42_25_T18]|nr:cytochrome B [Methylophaga sp. 42_25_T18]